MNRVEKTKTAYIKFDSLLNIKEYCHFLFLLSVFIISSLFFDVSQSEQRAQSILLMGVIGLLYNMQVRMLSSGYWKWGDDKRDTNYEIVGPFGLVFFALWIALVDYKTPDVISKYSGLLIFLTLLSAMAVNGEINKRVEERFVSDRAIFIHKLLFWSFFLVIYFIATRYFLIYGAWVWDIPGVVELIKLAADVR
jgi:hypothetical protein